MSDKEFNPNNDQIVEQNYSITKFVECFTGQENAERELYTQVKSALNEFLPRFVPDRSEVIEKAANSAVANFRAGIDWAENRRKNLDTK